MSTLTKKERKKLFDKYGRCTVVVDGFSVLKDDDKKERLVGDTLDFDFGKISDKLHSFFQNKSRSRFFEVDEFERRARFIRYKYINNPYIKNFFKRAWPIQLPQYSISNMGHAITKFFLPAIEKAYINKFPEGLFIDYCNNLSGNIAVFEGVGHKELLLKMKSNPVVAWYSPDSMPNVSIYEQRKVAKFLRRHASFSLAGIVDTSVALVVYMDSILNLQKEPSFDCSSIYRKTDDSSFAFNVRQEHLDFIPVKHIGVSFSRCSGGLLLWE